MVSILEVSLSTNTIVVISSGFSDRTPKLKQLLTANESPIRARGATNPALHGVAKRSKNCSVL